MEQFLILLEEHYMGILLCIVLFFIFLFTVDWMFRLFAWGKYKKLRPSKEEVNNQPKLNVGQNIAPRSGIIYLITDFLAKIITDFRHFLAVLLILIFGATLYKSVTYVSSIDELSKALQAVMGTIGTLIGSIMGYYYGESAARKTLNGTDKNIVVVKQPVQDQGNSEGPIKQAPNPPDNNDKNEAPL